MLQALVLIMGLLVVAALEAAFYLSRFLRERTQSELKDRLRSLPLDHGEPLLTRRERYAATPALARTVRRLPGARRIERMVAQADAPLTVAQLYALGSALALAGLVVPLAFGAARFPSTVVAVGLAAIPFVVTEGARRRRSSRLSEQLPDALDMMCRSLRAGHSLSASFQFVATQTAAPVAVEFGRAYEEQRFGVATEQAVVNLAERTPLNNDLRIFSMAVIAQRETGGNLAENLENLAKTLRDRYRFFAKLRSLTAEGRASGIVLGALTPLMFLVLNFINRHYFDPLYGNPIGKIFLFYAVGSWLLGLVWMRRMGQVDF